jgi:hypothetical protein
VQIRCTVRLNNPIIVDNHWPVPFQGGTLRLLPGDSNITGIEITCDNQPLDYAPSLIANEKDTPRTTISSNDIRISFVKIMLKSMIAYLQCYFDVSISFSDIEVAFLPEHECEKAKIVIQSMKIERAYPPSPISFDLITRAIMASEKSSGPQFEAALVNIARDSKKEGRFIDSFRYSFLLIESFYGAGKFKKNHLKEELKANREFVSMVEEALADPFKSARSGGSKIESLTQDASKPNDLIDYIVDQRGFYFHGNVSRKDAWKPQEQSEAELLCELALRIAMLIAQNSTQAMFEDELSSRHYSDAKKVGAIMSFQVDFVFRDYHEKINQKSRVIFSIPGTKPTPRMAQYIASQFLSNFEENAPMASLVSARCIIEGTSQTIFELRIDSSLLDSDVETES